MRVGFNTIPLISGHKTRGVGSYTRNLLDALQKRVDIEVVKFTDLKSLKNVDLVHYPFFDLFRPTLPIYNKFPTVVTIHDVIPLTFSKYYPPGVRGTINKWRQKLALLSTQAVIADSSASKKEIEKYLGVPPKKIHPVSLAATPLYHKVKDKTRLQAAKDKFSLPDKFVLYVGNVNWNKNLLNLTQACLDAGVDLVLVGKSFEQKDNLSHPELRSYNEFLQKYSHREKIHILGFVADEDLVAITCLSRALLLPSFAEGFGIPILDAQACGTPVITSRVSSMPEVSRDGALLVDPYKVEDIVRSIRLILDDIKLRDQLIKRGFENVKRFSWQKTADETINVYNLILNKAR